MNRLIAGGMPDTMEYYSIFHLTMKYEGVQEMLALLLITVMTMLYALIAYDRMVQMVTNIALRRVN